MTDTQIFRTVIPVDDQEHTVTLGEIIHVDTRAHEYVEVWHKSQPARVRTFIVTGTGMLPYDDEVWTPVGSAIGPGGTLVWHLLEKL